ncbi:hypothetical protein TRIATDRAFT_185737, partial [Trichoderma atroviride IMI 206040]
MPKAYQDTVRIARALGVKYIWIDALCIIQDDVSDWETESKMMAEIFQNALKSPWRARGWTFQEDMFATRKLYFGHMMMYWDSFQPPDVMRTEDKIIDDALDRVKTAKLPRIQSSSGLLSGYDYDAWYHSIVDYSEKLLTFETDRLPAVSSYAKLIAGEDVYLAGLWKNDLHRGLLWKIQRKKRKTFGSLMSDL